MLTLVSRLPLKRRTAPPPAAAPAPRRTTDFGGALKMLVGNRAVTAGHGAYIGTRELEDGPIRVWPLLRFFERLAAGDVLA